MHAETQPRRVAPPVREGLTASAITLPAGTWSTLIEFLAQWFEHVSRVEWESRFRRGLVMRDDGELARPDEPCREGLRLYYFREVIDEPDIPFQAQVVYQDEDLLIADKPHFLPVIPSGRYAKHTLLARLQTEFNLSNLAPLHRIDRATAGLVAFSVNPKTRTLYQQLFPQRAVHKLYHALAPIIRECSLPHVHKSRLTRGTPFFRMQESPGEANSETHIDLLERMGRTALYQLIPVTGKTHQLRVHMSALGSPILNDPFYPKMKSFETANDFSRPLMLLAKSLSFADPISGERRYFESPQSLPEL